MTHLELFNQQINAYRIGKTVIKCDHTNTLLSYWFSGKELNMLDQGTEFQSYIFNSVGSFDKHACEAYRDEIEWLVEYELAPTMPTFFYNGVRFKPWDFTEYMINRNDLIIYYWKDITRKGLYRVKAYPLNIDNFIEGVTVRKMQLDCEFDGFDSV